MQLIIEISDGLYNNLDEIKNGSIASKIILDCVRKGQVLPKGHGRLIDADKLLQEYRTTNIVHHYGNQIVNIVNDRTTVIEADKGGKMKIGCTRCPYAGHIELKECIDAYTEISQYCGLYNHNELYNEPKKEKKDDNDTIER